MDMKSKVAYGILITGTLLGLGFYVAAPSSPYTAQLAKLQKQLNAINAKNDTSHNKTQSETSNVTIDPNDKNSNLAKTMGRSDVLMRTLYTWSNHKSYETNRQTLLSDLTTDANSINNLMPEDKDNSGNSRIEALSLSSKYLGQKVYASDPSATNVIIEATVSSSQKSYDTNGANVNQLYKASYNPDTQRFTSIEYLGKESLQNSSGSN